MGDSIGVQIIIIIILTLINAFLAGAEMAFVSVNHTKLKMLIDDGNVAAKRVLDLLEDSDSFLSTIQVGITLAGFLSSASASQAFVNKLAPLIGNIPGASTIATVIVTLVLSYFTLVLGELYPKQLALQIPESYAMAASGPIKFLRSVFKPFVWILNVSTGFLKKITPLEFTEDTQKLTREEMRAVIKGSGDEGVIAVEEQRMMEGVLSLDDKVAREIMTPRPDTIMINMEDPAEVNIDTILSTQYSRIPVYEGDVDNVIGVVHIRDVLLALHQHESLEDINLADVMLDPYIIPETIFIDDLLVNFKRTQNHIAILKDEYGAVSGIVTLEDLIEEIVGEIEDEYDEISNLYRQVDPDTYVVNGSMPIDKFNELLGLQVESAESDSIGGYMIEVLGFFPSDRAEETIDLGEWTITTSAVDNGRIRGAIVERKNPNVVDEDEELKN